MNEKMTAKTNKVEAKKTTPVTGFTTGSQEGEQHE